jgi:hypothetical protein
MFPLALVNKLEGGPCFYVSCKALGHWCLQTGQCVEYVQVSLQSMGSVIFIWMTCVACSVQLLHTVHLADLCWAVERLYGLDSVPPCFMHVFG